VEYFEDSISAISKIIFSIGREGKGFETSTVTFGEKSFCFDDEHSVQAKSLYFYGKNDLRNKEQFLEEIRKLHIGEWRSRYTPERFGYFFPEGIHWNLTIEFSNGNMPFKVKGHNSGPYNFDQFKALVGMGNQNSLLGM
jgi:hypothetical protein